MIPQPKAIILIVLDTLRADHVSCYGYKRETTPCLDILCEEGIKFKYAFAACSYTVPSHASIFTGKYPHKHSVGFSNGPPTNPLDNDLFVTEILSDTGYETAGFVSSIVLGRENGGSLTPGFRTYDDFMTNFECNRPNEAVRLGENTTNAALQWLETVQNRNFYLFLHYFDIHGPYINKPPYDSLFVDDNLRGPSTLLERIVPEELAYDGIPSYQVLRSNKKNRKGSIDYERDANFYCAQYDGGIRYVDDCLDLFFSELKKRGIYDDSLIIITSDHGEALGENNVWFFHGLTVTLDQVHVPLIIKPHSAWGLKKRIVFEQVSLTDIFSTICHLVGFDVNHLDIDGRSLSALMEPSCKKKSGVVTREIMSEIEGQTAYIDAINMRIVPRAINTEKPKYFYVEHLSAIETLCPYRFSEPLMINTIHRDLISPLLYDISKFSQLHRYQFASQFIENHEVLNLFYGDLSGPQILSLKAKKVTALSPDRALVNYASTDCDSDSPNLTFLSGAMDDICVGENKVFDAIICILDFNSIENFSSVFSHVKRLMRKNGIAIFSVPSATYGTTSLYSWDLAYFQQFSVAKLNDMFCCNFSNVSWYQQEICPSFRVTAFSSFADKCLEEKIIKSTLSQKTCHTDQPKSNISHFLVICSQSDTTSELVDNTLFSSARYFATYANDYVHSLKLMLSKEGAKIKQVNESLEKTDAMLKHIINSNGWRWLKKYYTMRDKLLPPFSKRRRFLETIWNFQQNKLTKIMYKEKKIDDR